VVVCAYIEDRWATLQHAIDAARKQISFGGELLGVVDHNDALLAQPVRNLIGANMSFCTAAFDQVGGFAEQMVRIGQWPLGCEETEFCIRLTQANHGAIILYDPSAQVEHYVTQQCTSLGYFTRRCWAVGLSKAEVSQRVSSSNALSAERHFTRRVLPRGIWDGLYDCAAGDLWGPARSLAIVLGLAATAAGYGFGAVYRPSVGVL
jgi:hypothetical protein